MKEKFQNITNRIWSLSAVVLILIVWQIVCSVELVESFMLPSPVQVIAALVTEFPLLMEHAAVTMGEAIIGLVLGVLLGFVMAVFMDHYDFLYKAFYPLIVLTQTVPAVAIAVTRLGVAPVARITGPSECVM